MRVKIKQIFRDKYDYSLVYKIGEERDFAESRAQCLISLGLAEAVEPISIVQVEEVVEQPRKRGRKKLVENENL